MQLRYLRAADDQSATAGSIDELPGLLPWRVLEGRAAGAALDRLGRLARLGDLVHFGGDGCTIARRALKCGLGEDEILRSAAMPVAVVHIGILERVDAALAVHGPRLHQHVFGLALVGAAVHAKRTTDRARDTAQERKARKASLLRRP